MRWSLLLASARGTRPAGRLARALAPGQQAAPPAPLQPPVSGRLRAMRWLVLVLVLAAVLARLVRRRREVVLVSPSETISTLHTGRSKKTTKETKAALDAATRLLR
jgi:hypothetical protein